MSDINKMKRIFIIIFMILILQGCIQHHSIIRKDMINSWYEYEYIKKDIINSWYEYEYINCKEYIDRWEYRKLPAYMQDWYERIEKERS